MLSPLSRAAQSVAILGLALAPATQAESSAFGHAIDLALRAVPGLPGKPGSVTPPAPSLPGVTGDTYIVPFSDPTGFDREQPLSPETFAALQQSSDAAIALFEQGLEANDDGQGGTQPIADPTAWTEIQNDDGTALLIAGEDGNLSLAPVGSVGSGVTFQATDGVVTSDDQDRALFYFPDVMDARGVSRIRVADSDSLPFGSQSISLMAIDTGDGVGSYMAVDALENGYFLVTCTFVDQAIGSKVFIVIDVAAGINTLKAPGVQTLVTGGVVQDCGYVPFVSPGFAGN